MPSEDTGDSLPVGGLPDTIAPLAWLLVGVDDFSLVDGGGGGSADGASVFSSAKTAQDSVASTVSVGLAAASTGGVIVFSVINCGELSWLIGFYIIIKLTLLKT